MVVLEQITFPKIIGALLSRLLNSTYTKTVRW